MNEQLLSWFLNNIPFVLAVSLAVSLLRFRRIRRRHPAILVFVVVVSLFEIFSRTLFNKQTNNLPYLHLYTLIEFLIISSYFYRLLGDYLNRSLLLTTIVGFSAFAVLNAFFIQGLMNYNSYARTLECLLMISLCFVFYFRMLNELIIKEPLENSDFWITTAFFIYFSGSFILFILSDLLLGQSQEINLIAWAMHAFLLAALHILLSIGLWKTPR